MNLLYFKKQLNTFLTNTGISKNALAKTVNISQSQISNWSNYGLKRWTKNSNQNFLDLNPKQQPDFLAQCLHNKTVLLISHLLCQTLPFLGMRFK
jgi:hypothetical protein